MSIPELLQQLTLEEKASLCSGGDFWHTKAIERLGIPAMMMSDGPHGLRKQDETGDHMGINDSIKAVCFPAGCATASSFDRGLVERMGKALGNECQAENVGVLLGPAVNIKRSLCAAETSSITRKIPTLPAKWQHRSFRAYRASRWAPASSTFMPTIRNTAA